MKEHQLPNNCYTICESTEQCKQLFDWAKANEIETMYDNYEDENCLAYEDALITTTVEDCIEDGSTFMPLSEFITKLKGEPLESKTYTEAEVIDLLVAERTRAVEIVESTEEEYNKKAEMKSGSHPQIAYWNKDTANECRLIAMAISGSNALAATLGETMRDRIERQLNQQQP
jgi:hypothetical protein